jgi:hypothetical protein
MQDKSTIIFLKGSYQRFYADSLVLFEIFCYFIGKRFYHRRHSERSEESQILYSVQDDEALFRMTKRGQG